MSPRPLISLALSLQARLEEVRKHGEVSLTGFDIDIAAVLAIARYNCIPAVDEETTLARLSHSTDTLRQKNDGSTAIYGVHTGFGGSADTRTQDSLSLGTALMQLLQCGVLTDDDLNLSGHSQRQWPVPHCMPSSWTKATMAVRINQCVRGHSAIRSNTIRSLLKLIAAGFAPIVPLRGSISASGDLIPLSYVAGMLEGNTDIRVVRTKASSTQIMSACEGLAETGMQPLALGSREALGLVNGTAASAAVASLVMQDAMQLTLLSTGLTCLVSEGLAARVEWLHPFIAETRPHPGQTEVASIMRAFLKDSLLVSGMDKDDTPRRRRLSSVRPDGGLAQDRYPLRTSPQWLGPQFEDLLSAYSQIAIELNSTTDNPLIDPTRNNIHHGGNFQAVSITSAVEKIRSSLQMVGKLLFSQSTEMFNAHMNAGLPPNLAADDPSVSFCCKGLDISIAAYQSELSYLSNSISNHVQSAEMHNQAVNSLALLSARYTMKAVELLGLMTAGVLYAACQAIDLRVMHATFLEAVVNSHASLLPNDSRQESVEASLEAAFAALRNAWWNNAASDAADRCSLSATAFVHALCEPSRNDPYPRSESTYLDLDAKEMRQSQCDLQADMLQAYQTHRAIFMKEPTSEVFVGTGSKALYLWVRKELGIPMNCGLDDHPTLQPSGPVDRQTIGSHVSKIYAAVRDGRLFERFAAVSKELGLKGDGCYAR